MKPPRLTCAKGHPRNPDSCHIHTNKRGQVVYYCRLCRQIKAGRPLRLASERILASRNKYERCERITTIFFNSGHEAIIDAEDTERVISAGLWHISDKGYVRKNIKGTTVGLHQFLMGNSQGKDIDHINRNPLDCRKQNLRFVSRSQNVQNMGLQTNTKSGIKNVTWCSKSSKWRVRVNIGGTVINGGYFTDFESASAKASQLRQSIHTHCPENSLPLVE